MNPLPIIFIHKGNSWYLTYTLYQAHVTNPDSPIYLIGDNDTKHFPKWVTHISYSQYDSYSQKLRDVYQHKSILGKDFELLCIERWFVLYEFLVDKQIDNCIYLDSDILVYSNLSEAKKYTEDYAVTWSGFSAHSNYINNINALKNYCDNVIDSYTGKLPQDIKEKTLFYQRLTQIDNQEAISDMTFWYDFNVRYPGELLNISKQNTKGTFDISMSETRFCEDDGSGFKKIYWNKKIPQCKYRDTSQIVPMVTLHFQGKAKTILKKHFKYWSIPFFAFKVYNDIKIIITKIKNRLK